MKPSASFAALSLGALASAGFVPAGRFPPHGHPSFGHPPVGRPFLGSSSVVRSSSVRPPTPPFPTPHHEPLRLFNLTAEGPTSANGPIRQIENGQNRIGGHDAVGTFLLKDGAIFDMSRRGCTLTPPTMQWQCNEGVLPLPGFGISKDGLLTYHDRTTFWACPVNDFGVWNTYSEPVKNQLKCVSIKLHVHERGQSGGQSSQLSKERPQTTSQVQSQSTSTRHQSYLTSPSQVQSQPTRQSSYSASPSQVKSQPTRQSSYSTSPSQVKSQPTRQSSALPPSSQVQSQSTSTRQPSYLPQPTAGPDGPVPWGTPAPPLSLLSTSRVGGSSGVPSQTSAVPTQSTQAGRTSQASARPEKSTQSGRPSQEPARPEQSTYAGRPPQAQYGSEQFREQATQVGMPPQASYVAEQPESTRSTSRRPATTRSASRRPTTTRSASRRPTRTRSASRRPTRTRSTSTRSTSTRSPFTRPTYVSQRPQAETRPGEFSVTVAAHDFPEIFTPTPSWPSRPVQSQQHKEVQKGKGKEQGKGKEPGCPFSQGKAKPPCPLDLKGKFVYPELITPISEHLEDTALGAHSNGTIAPGLCSLYNFNIDNKHKGKKCTLMFLLPEHEKPCPFGEFDLSGKYELKGKGNLYFFWLEDFAGKKTTWANKSKASPFEIGPQAIKPGSKIAVHTGDCPAGDKFTVQICGDGSLKLEYEQGKGVEPMGLFVRVC